MNAPTDLMHTLAWSLLHFVWQGAAIAAFAAALMYVLRKPATRYLIGVGALALMLLSFAVTFSLLDGVASQTTDLPPAGAPAAVLVSSTETSSASAPPWAGAQAATGSSIDFAWLARGWLAGVFLLALRIAFGLFFIEQLRRRNLVALPDALVQRLQSLQSRLGISRIIRYAECGLVSVPAVIGFFRPVVLLPMRALTGLSQEQLEALVAHELGHIKRFDVAMNFVQVVAETLLFFHPAVWWLNKRIRADREDCCDDIAVSAGGNPVGYAKALAMIATWRDVPSFAMASTGGPVAARVARLLGVNRDGSRTAGVFTASLVLAGALIAGAASLGWTEPAQAQGVETAPAAPASPAKLPIPAAPDARPAPAARIAPAPKPARVAEPAPPARPAAPAHVNGAYEVESDVDVRADVEAKVEVASEVTADVRARTSYIEEMRKSDLGDLDVDQLIALRTQDVTAQYVKDIRATGLKPSVDQVIALKVQGVTPVYVQQLRNLGFDVSVDEIIHFKLQDISADYVKEVRAMGFDAGADEIVNMKIQGVSPEYVKQMRALGFKFDADDLIAFRVHDITPEYVKQMRANGFDADTHEIVALRVHDVTPAFRKSMESAGFKLNTDQLIHARIMDITPEFASKAAAHGFRNLDIDKLIALKNANVL